MIEFIAVIGPSAMKCHIAQVGDDMTLCKRTTVARQVGGRVKQDLMCFACVYKMAEIYQAEKEKGQPFMRCDTPAALAITIGIDEFVS